MSQVTFRTDMNSNNEHHPNTFRQLGKPAMDFINMLAATAVAGEAVEKSAL